MATTSESTASKPVSCIVIGMAGAGKTTLTNRWAQEMKQRSLHGYMVNLDPATVGELPFEASIDIRDTVDYKKVMAQYSLGPNGAIVTSLNLFATRFDQVLQYIERRASELHQVIFDTPGQIEVFTWSASGTIITEALASTLPTCIVYIIDTPRAQSPATFISNMMYACSILYKTRLPIVLAFNKIDVVRHDFAHEWMTDFEAFQEACRAPVGEGVDEDAGSYMSSLSGSMGLVLEEFYNNLEHVGVSAATGEGFDELFRCVERTRAAYESDYLPALRKRQAEKQREHLERFERDHGVKK